jgi:anti-sigma regulatory factor (Ser/Thr protein kinase)
VPSSRARVVVSELVSNVIRHALGNVHLALLLGDATLRVEVSDRGDGRVGVDRARDFVTGGRGLMLVERLTDRWGVEYHADGKTVWAEWRQVSGRGR